jgi:ATP-dependent RNA helicase DDX60
MRTMMIVLSHIFSRQLCRETNSKRMKEVIHRSPSNVYLPPLPTDAAKILQKHNNETLAIFATYVKTFAAQHLFGEESCLPLSRITVGVAAATFDTPPCNVGLRSRSHEDSSNANATIGYPNAITFIPSLPVPHARSPFVALSGHGDNFTTISDLCSSTRAGIFLESAVIPHLELYQYESRAPLNAYLLDFFSHGAVKPLEEANGIRRSDVWFVLNDFSLVLATIVVSLANYLGLVDVKGEASADAVTDEGSLLMLNVMGSGDSAENEDDENLAVAAIPSPPSDPVYASSITSASNAASKRNATKGQKVADEWDQEIDDSSAAAGEIQERTIRDCNFDDGDGDGDEEVWDGSVADEDEEYHRLLKVYIAFRQLKTEFDAKFQAIWV